MATQPITSTTFWQRLRRGPWAGPEPERLRAALREVAWKLSEDDDVVGVIAFGSYTRGHQGRRSDVDLLVVVRRGAEMRRMHHVVNEATGPAMVDFRLPMDLSAYTVEMGKREDLPPHLAHEIWTDGVVLYGEMSALAAMRPDRLSLWHVVRFTLKNATPAERNRLSRRLHGLGGRPGLLRKPAYQLGRGALFVPADQARAIADALDEAGASYDMTPVWRDF